MYPIEKIEKIRQLRSNGYSSTQIMTTLSLPKGVVCWHIRKMGMQWKRGTFTKEGAAAMRRHVCALVENRNQEFLKRRTLARSEALTGSVSINDAMCVGLYWGEGDKSKRSWGFCNSDRLAIRQQILWAIRRGQPEGQFVLRVQIHPEDITSQEDIKKYWAWCGVEESKVVVYRSRSPSSKMKSRKKTPFGTCSIRPIKNAATLYEKYAGQLISICNEALEEK